MVDLQKYFSLFAQTSEKHISFLEENYILVQEKYADEAFMKAIHLEAHSLKGEAAIMEFRAFGTYCTVIEKFLKNILMKKEPISDEVFVIFKNACVHLQESYKKIITTQSDVQGMLEEAKDLEVKLGIPGSI